MKKLARLLFVSSMLAAATGLSACDADAGKTVIGILQPVEHAALTAAREGFMEAINDAGLNVKFQYQNANGVEADQNTMAKSLVAKSALTLGIGTGASLSLQAAALNSGSTKPILFTAVTDPVDAGLVASNDAPGGHITGASDMNPVAAQIDLIKECLPSAQKIGIFYTQSETNSKVQADMAAAEATRQGLAVEIMTCTDSSDIAANINTLCGSKNIDALYIPTDNNVAAHMQPVKNAVENYHILTVCGEESLMARGGHITLSISYKELGRRTGEMAVKILRDGADPATMPVISMTAAECSYVMCNANAEAAGVTIPDSVKAKCTNVEPASDDE